MYGYIRQDDSGHYYVIPELRINEYDELADKIDSGDDESTEWQANVNTFIAKFDNMRVNGGLSNLKVAMASKPEGYEVMWHPV